MKFFRKHTNPISGNGIGLTAHFTSAIWAEMQVPGANIFVTLQGKWVRQVVRWGGATLGLYGPYEVANLFLTPRHLGINALLEQQNFTQIIELASGLSSRGHQWANNHSGIYLEIDQASVICCKQKMLAAQAQVNTCETKARHFLLAADLRQADLAALVSPYIDFTLPTLIICEGLTGYFNETALTALLQKIRRLAAEFDHATVWLDLYLQLDWRKHGRVAWAMLPAQVLWKLLKSPMKMFLQDDAAIQRILTDNNFQVQKLWSARELANLAHQAPPPITLFYLAELTLPA